ncbi:lipopolysaccharide biosynthesis protein [Limosilactobacillus fermentum]
MRSKVLTGFFWKFGETISSQLVSFILSIILARLLSPRDYGIVAIVNIFIIIANVFVTSGFGTSLIQKKEANEVDFSTIFYLSELMSLVIYVIIFFSAPAIASFYNNEDLIPVLRVFALQLPLSAFNSIQQAYISKHLMFKKVFISTTIASVLSGVIGIIMAYCSFGVWALVYQSLSNTILVSITLAAQIKWYPQLKFSWTAGKPLINFGWKILLTELLGQVFNQLRSLTLGKFYTASDLAYYNRGQRFPDLITTNIDSTVSTVLFPVLSGVNNDVARVKSVIRRAVKTSTFVIMPLLFGLAATAGPLIDVILTKKWMQAVAYLQILAFSDVFDTVSGTNMQAIKALGRSDILLKLEFIKKPIYLVLLIIGIRIDTYAVAYTMVIYNIVAVLVNMAPNKKLMGYSFKEQFSDILPALLNSTMMFIVVYTFGKLSTLSMLLTLIIQIILGVLVYVVLAHIFRLEALRTLREVITHDV